MRQKQPSIFLIIFLVISPFLITNSFAEKIPLKIAVVDMNRAINESENGQRSKKIIQAAADQSQKELKSMEREIITMQTELQNSMLLSSEAKQKKLQEITEKKKALQKAVMQKQQELRKDESRHTGNIFRDLKVIVEKIAKKRKYDLVLESNLYQTILYSSTKMTDITPEIIQEYDKIQSVKKK